MPLHRGRPLPDVEPRLGGVTFPELKGLAWKNVDLVRAGTIAFRGRRPVSIARLSGTGTHCAPGGLPRGGGSPAAERRPLLDNCIVMIGVLYQIREQGHTVDALASGADEGRGRLR